MLYTYASPLPKQGFTRWGHPFC